MRLCLLLPRWAVTPRGSRRFLTAVLRLPVAGREQLDVDWPFLEAVTPRYSDKLQPRSDEQRKDFQFERQTFLDAVIMPWYRNQDQPQVGRGR